ncbi:MAG: alpha/beta fold hydrolase [Chthoniobacterales bacterium]
MPLLSGSSFRPACGLGNGHVQTIWPVLFRRLPNITNQRERLDLPDGDFLDLDWARHEVIPHVRRRLVILTHGLESSSCDVSIQGMAAAFYEAGWDVLAWNMRGCSGEPNRLPRFYHSGETRDLAAVIDHVSTSYDEVGLIGFSLGGNIILKYLAEPNIAPSITGAVTFSVPCDLASSVDRLDAPDGRIYTRRFIRSLRAKIHEKKRHFPAEFDVTRLETMRTFHEFDSAYTAPLHGFSSAEDYWRRASCLPVLGRIRVRTLLVSAINDPFLSPACLPFAAARESDFLHLETPASGGHCGFISSRCPTVGWPETRALEFLG